MTEAAVCPICNGTGWKIVERAGLSGAERCSCYGVARAQALRESASIPPNYEGATLESFSTVHDSASAAWRQVKGFVREFPAKDRPGLLLTGGTGVGKTHLAIGAMKVLLERGHECVFFDYQNLIERIRSSWDSTAGTADREAYRSALETEVLVLDDLGSIRPIDWVMDIVTSIVTSRYNSRRALIATTNLPDHDLVGQDKNYAAKTLSEVIGMRARSRLHEMCRIVDMSGIQDYRLKPAR